MKVIAQGEFGDVIRRYFQSSFPKLTAPKGKDLLEIISSILVGSKELRYGPMPPPENLVKIRETITKSISLNHPIPVLIPWGGRKMNKYLPLDIAEASALRQLLQVDECIRRFYAPGLMIRIRIEDTGAYWLYKEADGIEKYSIDFRELIEMLKGDTKIIGILESEMMDTTEYMELSEQYSPLLMGMITAQMAYPGIDPETIPEYQVLKSKGWVGTIPEEQRDYYIDRYKRMNPDQPMNVYVQMLADYFAGSKARYDLNGRGNPVTPVGSFIQISFAHPVPGAPEGLFNNMLYYRTVPASAGRTHIAPWRAKGYLEVINDMIVPKIVHPGANIPDLTPNTTQMVDESHQENCVNVCTDYTYKDLSVFIPHPYMV